MSVILSINEIREKAEMSDEVDFDLSSIYGSLHGETKSTGGLNTDVMRAIARAYQIKGRSKMNRFQLQNALKKIYHQEQEQEPTRPIVVQVPLVPKPVIESDIEFYIASMIDLVYLYVPELSKIEQTSCSNHRAIMHHYRFLEQESKLWCHWNSSVYIRVSEEDLSTIHFMIVGPVGTPYANGLYHFIMQLPSEFPAVPPIVKLINTGSGKIRHNPNLYACGKVCLSILGTWTGPGWTTNCSLADVILGILSQVFTEMPYRNEPGFSNENYIICNNYNIAVRMSTMQEAMIDMIKNPPKGFQDVVLFHFFGPKKNEILKQITDWEKSSALFDQSLIPSQLEESHCNPSDTQNQTTYYANNVRRLLDN